MGNFLLDKREQRQIEKDDDWLSKLELD